MVEAAVADGAKIVGHGFVGGKVVAEAECLFVFLLHQSHHDGVARRGFGNDIGVAFQSAAEDAAECPQHSVAFGGHDLVGNLPCLAVAFVHQQRCGLVLIHLVRHAFGENPFLSGVGFQPFRFGFSLLDEESLQVVGSDPEGGIDFQCLSQQFLFAERVGLGAVECEEFGSVEEVIVLLIVLLDFFGQEFALNDVAHLVSHGAKLREIFFFDKRVARQFSDGCALSVGVGVFGDDVFNGVSLIVEAVLSEQIGYFFPACHACSLFHLDAFSETFGKEAAHGLQGVAQAFIGKFGVACIVSFRRGGGSQFDAEDAGAGGAEDVLHSVFEFFHFCRVVWVGKVEDGFVHREAEVDASSCGAR